MIDMISYDDVVAAAERIAGHAHRTPVLHSRLIDDQVGATVLFKCENLQRMGAFKFRGAYNALAQFSPAQRRAGVVAFSSGNHAQAIALSAQLLGIPATIVMPLDAPEAKSAATKAYGAEVITYDRYTEDREQVCHKVAADRGLTLIPPFDHPHIVAGQGTAAKELFEEVGELDALFVPLGGGGLLAGTALSTRALSPRCHLYGVEPAAGDDVRRSLRAGERVKIDTPRTIADGAQTQQVGELTFEIIRRNVNGVITATDNELVAAMRDLATYLKLVVEPTGALGFAGLRTASRTGRIGVIISGGNVGLEQYGTLLRDGRA